MFLAARLSKRLILSPSFEKLDTEETEEADCERQHLDASSKNRVRLLTLVRQMIVVCRNIGHTDTASNEETFIQDFLEIQKYLLEDF